MFGCWWQKKHCVPLQELDGKLKIVKVEADPNPGLVEKYKVSCNLTPTFVSYCHSMLAKLLNM